MSTKIASGWIDILAPLKGLRSDFAKIERDAKKSGDDASSGFSTKFVAGLAAAGVAAGAALIKGVGNALEVGKVDDKLAASLGSTPAEAAELGKVSGHLYADAYGESIGDVSAAVGAVQSTIGRMATLSSSDLESLTTKALDFSTAFDQDVDSSVQKAGVLISSGLAKDGTQAFDLLTAAAQRVPAALRGDLLDAVGEYSQDFAALGFTGESAMGLLTSAAGRGQYVLDKTGDALKEFGIRATDGSTATMEAFAAIGKDGDQLANRLLAGGDSASAAFAEIAGGLVGIKDPAKQAQAAIALFGTPLEDMQVTEIPAFLAAMAEGSAGLEGFEGAAARMGETLNDNAATQIEGFNRKADQLATKVGTTVLGAFASLPGPVADFAAGLKGIGGPIMDVVAGVAPIVGGLLTMSAAQGTATGTSWALNAAMTALPFVAIGVAVAALAYLVYRNWDTIKSAIGSAVRWISDTLCGLVDWFSRVGNKIGEAFAGVGKMISYPFLKAFDLIAQLWNSTVGALSFKVPGWVPMIGGKGFDVPDLPRIQGLAGGGTVVHSGMFDVGENGRERVYLPAGAAVASSPSLRNMERASSTTARTTEIVQVVIDKKVLAEAVRDRFSGLDTRNAG